MPRGKGRGREDGEGTGGRALPVEEVFTEEEIAQRIAEGVPVESADEYLLRVRFEGRRMPHVTTSAINPRDFDGLQTKYMPEPPKRVEERNTPLPEWERHVVADFVGMRQCVAWHGTQRSLAPGGPRRFCVEKLPLARDASGWRQFMFGKAPSDGHPGTEGRYPAIAILLQLDQVSIVAVLAGLMDWIVSRKLKTPAKDGSDEAPPTAAQCAWVYALLTRLDKPLTAEMTAQLRGLVRFCQACRNRMAPEDTSVGPLSVLVTVIRQCFGQADL